MVSYNQIIEGLIKKLAKFPGIGSRTAERLVLYILKSSVQEAESLARSIIEVKKKITYCVVCNNLSEAPICRICRGGGRDKSIICVVEEPSDIAAIEKTGSFNGVYHVLLGVLSPLDGMGPAELTINQLLERVNSGGVKEVIIATNCNTNGESTALYLVKLIKPLGVRVSRIARGIPVGSNLEYADRATLSKAMEARGELHA
ncbi:MAG: recombination mediator RecR [Candidatus Omnitrophota bacterium]|nr:recombination mediator RecR [Candidatus Omnitrophota bacterium]